MEEYSVVVDFDGTICEHKFPDTGEPLSWVREALVGFKKLGLIIIIHSVRTASYWKYISDNQSPIRHLKIIQDYMKKHNLPYDEICLADKPLAIAYIDDRGVNLNKGWQEAYLEVREMCEKLKTPPTK